MNDTVKKENRKALPKFLLILLGAAVLGGVLGFLSALLNYSSGADALADGLRYLVGHIVPWAIPALSLVLLIAGVWQYRRAKGLFAAWDGEDEDAMDAAENCLNRALLLTTLIMVLNFFLMAAAAYSENTAGPLPVVGAFVLAMLAVVVLQQKTVDLTKRMNPEKRGSVYDMKFHKKWLDSCDEAERQQIGQAAYHAYQVTSYACLVLWVLLLVGDVVYEFGLLPVFVVTLLWGVLQVSYILECIRQSGRKK